MSGLRAAGLRLSSSRRDGAPSARHAPARPGFTLLETMLAIVVIGVGVIAIINAQRAFLTQNLWSTHASTATYLAGEIREMTRGYPRHDRFSGGIYFSDPENPGEETFVGWGPEGDETGIADLDDLDDFDGAVFGEATDLPEGFVMTRRYAGPIDSFGCVITETLWNGATEMIEVEGELVPVSMRGWTQCVTVEKVDPYDLATPVDDWEIQVEEGTGNVLRDVDRYPVRVTVTVLYQGTWDEHAPPVTSISWIVFP